MASRVEISKRRDAATKRLEDAIGKLTGEGLTLPTQGRDPELLFAQQLETLADAVETLSVSKPKKTAKS